MKRLLSKSATTVVFIFVAGAFTALAQAADSHLVEGYIAKHAKAERAEEYAEARKVIRGDVNHDGKPDIIVLYTLEGFRGGNNYLQYLAVFLGNGKTFLYSGRVAVGGKLNRDVSLVSVTNEAINVDTMEYRSKGPACCPSRKGKARFVFSGGKLKEIR
jgi:hypothetical protein